MTIKRSRPRIPLKASGSDNLQDVSRAAFSKSDARYWLVPGRLFKDHGVADYSCRFSHKGQRAQVCLKTANQREAARKAADLFSKILAEGWEAGLADYRPEKISEKQAYSTVGDLIEAASSLSSVRPQTLQLYIQAFRCLVSEIHRITSDDKNDFGKGGTLR
ncbi:MAG: hypothetical protein QM680_13340 [Luteolibacter sp.]